MIDIVRTRSVRYLLAASLATIPAWTWAGNGAVGTITFQPLNTSSVPTLGGAMMILLAALLAFIAFRSMRDGKGRGSTGMFLVGTLVAGSVLSGLGGLNLMRDAVAGVGNTITNPDGATKDIFKTLNTYNNDSGVTMRVTDITFTDEGERLCNGVDVAAELAVNGNPDCEVNGQLAQGEACEIDCREVSDSDVRLKTDITPAGYAENGLPLYEFRYIDGTERYRGVMAQDVLLHAPEAVVTLPSGYFAVNYGMLGLRMQHVQ
jgi:hypothetical protein